MKTVPSFVLVAFILANGRHSTAAEECDQNENMLAPGRWYQYGFDIRAEAASVGSTDDVSDMNLTCRVRVSHIGSCKYLFQVQQCTFSSGGGPPGSKELWIEHDDLSELAKFPVVVSLSGGVVNGLKVSPSEPEHFLNIKRALISAFVLRKSHMTEGAELQRVDIHGTCPWKMWPGADAGTAHSSKDMLYCAYPERPDWNLSPWAFMWNLHFVQYLINSTVECTYHASSGSGDHLESLHCHERHAIKLESTHDTTTAVQTNVFYKMSLESQGVIETPASDFGDLLDLVPAGIAFKHLPAPDPTLANFEGDEKSRLDEATRDKLAELVLTAETEIKLFTIPLFHEFVELLRKSNDLVGVVESVANCNSKPDNVDVGEKFCTGKWKMLAMSFLQDALIQSNTVPAMRAFRHLVAHGHVNRAYLPLAFHSWSFLRNNDTRYLEEVFEICKSTEHKMCWLLAGRMIRKYHANNVDKSTVPPISVTVIRHMSAFLGSKCDIDAVSSPAKYSKPQKMDHLVVMLKALKNAGSAVQVANPVLEQILLACAQNGDLPIPVAVFAVEAVQEFPLLAYDTLLAVRELLVDRSRPWELRIAVYKLLTRGPDRWKLGMAVSSALAQEPRHSELVDYAVSDFLDSLPKELRTALQEGQFDTDSVIPGEKFYASDKHYGSSTGGSDQPRKSGRRSYERRVRLPFMPPELSGFAVKVDSEEIFGGWKNLLPDLSRNVTLQLFGTEFHFADVTVFFKEIEQLVLSVARLSEGEWRPDWDVFLDLLKPWGGSSRLKRPLKHFPKLQTGLKKILDLTPPVGRMSLTPLVDLNMFGTDLTFSSYGEILVALASVFVPPEPLDQFLRQPRSFDVVRTIRIIEGYHQVPTMLGLPLNWTTSATLVASLRSEASYTGQGNINVKLHPSGALTFLNRMLLDFPTKTRIGVQANSSAYTSTQLSAVANLQRESARLEVHIPQGEQKILQLVRTNQLIKHDRFEEMGDWNVQRVNVDWCTGGGLGRVTGLQLCHDRSYANVTHLMRPWFLMAAPASWQLVLRPYSEDISSVVVAAVIPSRNKQFRIDVLTKGVTEKTQLTLQSQENGGLVAFVPDAPFLRAAMTKGSVGEDPDAGNAVVTEYALGYAPGQQVVLTYRDLAKEEKRQKPAKETNRFLNSEVTVGVRQRSLTLRAGSSSYGLSWKTNTQPTGVKQELRINFEGGTDGPATWLRDVVADEFFTKDGSGGWAHLLYHWKAPTTIGRHKVAHSSHGHIATPKTVLDLASYFLESGSRQLTQINLTKVEKGTQRLLAFANYTQEHWRHVKGDVARRSARYNLTVSHHSWALHFDEESRKSTAEVIGQIRLLSERMRRRQDNWGFFSTWWHPSTSHLFEAELGKTELLWSTRPVRSSRKDPGRTALEATLRHHSGDSEPFSLQLLGNVTLLPSGLEADWLLGSADSDLRWEAHSRILGLAENSALPRELTYHYTLHYKGKPFGTYRLQVRSSDKPCLTWELRHNVTSEPWLYTSNVSYACDPLTHGTSAAKAYMNLTVFSASPVWKLLDTDLKQVFEFGPTGYESMNMSSGLGDVTVKGRWDAHSYVKEAKFSNTHMDWIPVELFFNVEKRGWIFDAKYRPHSTSHGIRVISVSKRSVRSGAATIYDAKLITNRQELDPYAQEQSLFQVVVVPREGDTVVTALLNEPATQSLLTVAGATAARGMREVVAALYDPGHPVHRMLHPLTGGTPLGELADMQRYKAQDFLAKVWTTSAEVLGSFHSIYEPVLYTGSGLFRKAAVASGLAEAAFRQTIPGWAFYYFHLDWVLAHTVSHAPQLSAKVAKMYFTTPSEVPGITEVSAHVPRLLSYDHIRKHIGGVFQEHRAHSWTLPRLEKGQRVAAIFGVGHVVTFDGVFLEFPSYPASYCTYLLSTVVGGRLFTVATSAEDLLVEFPEVTISILGKEGRVAVNAGDAPVHLPLVLASGKVSVYREGHLVRVRGHGLAVYCDVAKFFCTFVLDRSVHGTLLGILGNADGNPNNDDELPDGATAQDAAQLAAGYELSGNAECRALVNPVRSAPVSGAAKCWQQVPQALKRCLTETKNEELFHEACSWDVSHRSSPCTSINAMAAYCTHHGYWVPDNLHCDHCHNSSEAAGKKSFRLKSAPILEVVVLLAESSFEPRVATSVLAGTQRLVDAVDAAFKARGHDTKFAFVLNGGGEGPHYRNPHLRTGAKDVFVPHVSAAGKLLKSIGRSSSRSVTTDLGLTLGYALDTVPFSAEAARVVLAIAASDFNCSRHELDRLHEKTHRSGVTVYAFSHYPTVDQRGRVFGVRADGLVFPESTAGEEYLDYPSRAGLLAKLAAATKGSAFQVQFVEAGLPAQFFEVVAQEIFAKVGKEARGCRDCTCEQGRAWGSVARCRPVGC